MKAVHYEENTVNEIVRHIPGAGLLLQEHDVITTTAIKMPLSEAAQTVSATPDELLAVLEYRVRRAARNHRATTR